MLLFLDKDIGIMATNLRIAREEAIYELCGGKLHY